MNFILGRGNLVLPKKNELDAFIYNSCKAQAEIHDLNLFKLKVN